MGPAIQEDMTTPTLKHLDTIAALDVAIERACCSWTGSEALRTKLRAQYKALVADEAKGLTKAEVKAALLAIRPPRRSAHNYLCAVYRVAA